jgi:hypothetical protein
VVKIEKRLLKRTLEYLKNYNDDGPAGRGWQSDGLMQLIDDLEDVLGIAHENRWKGFFK